MRAILLTLILAACSSPVVGPDASIATRSAATLLCLHRDVCHEVEWDFEQCLQDVEGCVYEVGECLDSGQNCENTQLCLERTCI